MNKEDNQDNHLDVPIQSIQSPESKSPNDDQQIKCELQKPQEQSQLSVILEEQNDIKMLQLREQQRLERIKNLPITIKRQLSTINEISSDQSVNNSQSPYVDKDHQSVLKPKENILFEISEENKSPEHKHSKFSKKKSLHKKKKRPVSRQLTDLTASSQNVSIPDLEYRENLNLQFYYKDKRIDCNWKLLFSYICLIIVSNIILQIIEIMRYSQSVCKLDYDFNISIYGNQVLYILGKIGVLSLIYQEFTNTLPTKQKLPLLNAVMFSSIFVVLSMPIYIFDFTLCIPRNKLFSLYQGLYIVSFLDWTMISIIIIVIVYHSILKLSLKKKTWKKLKKFLTVFYYLYLIMIHLLQLLVTFTQSTEYWLPAMLMENFYMAFSILAMIYLSIQKYCYHQEPFLFLQNEQNIDEKPQIKIEPPLEIPIDVPEEPIKFTRRMKISPQSSQFNSVQTTQINLIGRKD